MANNPAIPPSHLQILSADLWLKIFEFVPDIWNFTQTNKHFLGVGAGVLVRQATTSNSFFKAVHAIRCMTGWTKTDHLVAELCTRARTQVIKHVQDDNPWPARGVLQVIRELPDNAHVRDDYFDDVVETCRKAIIKNISTGICMNTFLTLEVIRQLPDNARIPENYFFDVVKICREVVIGVISDSSFDKASESSFRNAWLALEAIRHLPDNTHIPDHYFFDVYKMCLSLTIKAVKNRDLDKAGRIAEVMRSLPNTTRIPNNYFKVVKTCRESLIKAIKNRNLHEVASILLIIRRLPVNTHIPGDYFFEVVKTCRESLIMASSNSSFDDAGDILDIIEQLPENTHIPDDYFCEVRQICQDLAIEAIMTVNLDDVQPIISVMKRLPGNARVPDDAYPSDGLSDSSSDSSDP